MSPFGRYADGLRTGLLTVPEVLSAVLDHLAESEDRAGDWANAPEDFRSAVLTHLRNVGLDAIPSAFRFGPDRTSQALDPTRREVAVWLLKPAPRFEPDEPRPPGSG